jgi:hypothetical protein
VKHQRLALRDRHFKCGVSCFHLVWCESRDIFDLHHRLTVPSLVCAKDEDAHHEDDKDYHCRVAGIVLDGAATKDEVSVRPTLHVSFAIIQLRTAKQSIEVAYCLGAELNAYESLHVERPENKSACCFGA